MLPPAYRPPYFSRKPGPRLEVVFLALKHFISGLPKLADRPPAEDSSAKPGQRRQVIDQPERGQINAEAFIMVPQGVHDDRQNDQNENICGKPRRFHQHVQDKTDAEHHDEKQNHQN